MVQLSKETSGFTGVTVGDLCNSITRLAPLSLAEPGDPSGLLVGERHEPVKRILLAMDITNEVALEAVHCGAQMVISHHPVIYSPRKTLSTATDPACTLLTHRIAALCMHTNMDMARGGVNDTLIKMLGWKPTKQVLKTVHRHCHLQLIVFVPSQYEEPVRIALCDAGAGRLGDYMDCSFSSTGTGRFLPLEIAHPFVGDTGYATENKEVRLELIVPPGREGAVIEALLNSHPYEEPSFQLLENKALEEVYGYGRVCLLSRALLPDELGMQIKNSLSCCGLRMNSGGRPIQKIAVCAGSGGSFLPEAMALGVDALLTGDVKYNQFIDAKNAGITIFDAGHFHTEKLILPVISKAIQREFSGLDVLIAAGSADPVIYL